MLAQSGGQREGSDRLQIVWQRSMQLLPFVARQESQATFFRLARGDLHLDAGLVEDGDENGAVAVEG